MAEKIFNGKTWNIRLKNGELSRDKKTGRVRYFKNEKLCNHFVEHITEQEENPRPPSWHDAVREARAKVYSEVFGQK